MPKDPALRQRRNKSSTRALLPPDEAPIVRAPRLPKKPDGSTWTDLAQRWWHDVWSSPMRQEFLRADLGALFRLVYLIDMYWTRPDLDVAKEIRMVEREFGLTPLSRRRLEWTVTQVEEAKERHEQRRVQRAVVVDVDPRKVLE